MLFNAVNGSYICIALHTLTIMKHAEQTQKSHLFGLKRLTVTHFSQDSIDQTDLGSNPTLLLTG